MFGLVQAGLLLWTQSGLQHGVEVAARCASVNYSANQLGLNHKLLTSAALLWHRAPSPIAPSQQYAAQNSCGIVPSSSSFTVHSPPSASAKCGTNIGYVVTVSPDV